MGDVDIKWNGPCQLRKALRLIVEMDIVQSVETYKKQDSFDKLSLHPHFPRIFLRSDLQPNKSNITSYSYIA